MPSIESVESGQSLKLPTKVSPDNGMDIAEYFLVLGSGKKDAGLSSGTIEPISKWIKEIKDYADLID